MSKFWNAALADILDTSKILDTGGILDTGEVLDRGEEAPRNMGFVTRKGRELVDIRWDSQKDKLIYTFTEKTTQADKDDFMLHSAFLLDKVSKSKIGRKIIFSFYEIPTKVYMRSFSSSLEYQDYHQKEFGWSVEDDSAIII